MQTTGLGRAAVAAAILGAAVLALGAVEPVPQDTPAHPPAAEQSAEPPAGQLLIASAQIQDPRFFHAVILLLRHNQDGAFGIVVNRPLAEHTIESLLAAIGVDDNSVEGTIQVFAGGPVDPQYGFLVHSADYHRAETLDVDGSVAMTASKEALRDLGHHQGPKKCFFAFGYAGWGAGQLEGEIERHDWFTTPEAPDLVFDEERGTVWDRALARREL